MENHNNETILDTMPATAMGVLQLFATSKDEIERFANKLIDDVKEGRVDALTMAVFMKTVEKLPEVVNKSLAENYLNEVSKYSEKIIKHRGAEISVVPFTRYDYSACGHPGWNDLQKIATETNARLKEIEDQLRNTKEGYQMLVEDEVVQIHPPAKTQKDTLRISIK